jgi:hypothetical protein
MDKVDGGDVERWGASHVACDHHLGFYSPFTICYNTLTGGPHMGENHLELDIYFLFENIIDRKTYYIFVGSEMNEKK